MLPSLENSLESPENVHTIESISPEASNEETVNNKIDKDLQSVLRPLNLMQAIVICSKYRISDNKIKPHSRLYNWLGFTLVIAFRILSIHKLLTSNYPSNVSRLVAFLYMINIFDFVFNAIGFFLNSYVNIIHRYNNVWLVLKLQHIHRILNINSKNLQMLIIYNWISAISIYIVFIMYMCYISLFFPVFSVFGTIVTFSTISFDINVIHALLLIKLLRQTLRMWILKLLDLKNTDTVSNDESLWTQMFDAYKNILDVYKMIEKLFKLMVSIFL
ncbi:hypothetical protein B5X24_HaOG200716 [Helicoverpa armigera]|uniref:Gustatory receptor n=1 Tax=Helicoverpa armigera TaxID=29058 RepID=A0A2W1BWK9_HELAM|nr:hypothetical protein B5X24_HaOG200716 [Helicoverpa armigera]